jgi:hypothetical protein
MKTKPLAQPQYRFSFIFYVGITQAWQFLLRTSSGSTEAREYGDSNAPNCCMSSPTKRRSLLVGSTHKRRSGARRSIVLALTPPGHDDDVGIKVALAAFEDQHEFVVFFLPGMD